MWITPPGLKKPEIAALNNYVNNYGKTCVKCVDKKVVENEDKTINIFPHEIHIVIHSKCG